MIFISVQELILNKIREAIRKIVNIIKDNTNCPKDENLYAVANQPRYQAVSKAYSFTSLNSQPTHLRNYSIGD
jgi:hypothetical protein